MPQGQTYTAPNQRGRNWFDPSTRYDENYDERSYWTDEIQRIRTEIERVVQSQRNSAGASPQAREQLRALQDELRQARMNLARAPQRESKDTTRYGQPPSLDLSQIQGQGSGEGDGRMNPDEFLNWMDRFMRRSAGWKSKYGNTADLPGAWTPEDAGPARSQMDPMAVIRSAQPRLTEEMNRAFGSAAQRLGAAGVPLSSSSYTKELGKGARKATTDLAEIANKYLFESAESQAGRDQEARQAALDRSLSAWGTRGGWQMDQGQQWESQWPMLLQMFSGMMPGIRWR